jgi:predicted XRE-type DNA-binding protein
MDSTRSLAVAQIKKQKHLILNDSSDISLNNCLNSEVCQGVISNQEFRERIYTPVRTLFTFIRQVLGEMADILKIDKAEVSKILNCHINRFTLDRLIRLSLIVYPKKSYKIAA